MENQNSRKSAPDRRIERKNSRNFDPIRRVVEHMYTYGFFAREDYVRAGLVSSPRLYDTILRQLRDLYFLDTDPSRAALTVSSVGKIRRYQFQRDYFTGQGRSLEAVFGLHSISESGVSLTLFCLALASRPGGVSVSEAVRTAGLNGAAEGGEDCTATVSRRLKSLLDAGYLKKNKRRYALSDPIPFDSLSDEDLKRLWYLASFCAGSGYPRVTATFLRNALRRVLLFRGLSVPREAFLFRDSPCGNMLDEQIVQELECFIGLESMLEITAAKRSETEYELSFLYFRWDKNLIIRKLMALGDYVILFFNKNNTKSKSGK